MNVSECWQPIISRLSIFNSISPSKILCPASSITLPSLCHRCTRCQLDNAVWICTGFQSSSNTLTVTLCCSWYSYLIYPTVTWLKYCQYGVKLYSINQSIPNTSFCFSVWHEIIFIVHRQSRIQCKHPIYIQ